MKIIDSTITSPKLLPAFTAQKAHMAFIDIETTGLSPLASSLYLIGILYFEEKTDTWKMRQWFADDYRSEKTILMDFLDFLKDYQYLYHFNGNTFDLPYLTKKCARHQIPIPDDIKVIFEDKEDRYSIDLLKHIRRLKSLLSLGKCNQTNIEHWLGIKRTDTFHGGDLIPVYSAYMQKKIIDPQNANDLEKVLLLHNHDDIEMMLSVSSLLQYENYLSPDFQQKHPVYPQGLAALLSQENLTHLEVTQTSGQITLTLPLAGFVPKNIQCLASFPANDDMGLKESSLTFFTDHLNVSFPVYHGTLKLFLPNYADYYYLPEEDCAMHKSVAEFVEKSHRQKATASTCYLKKEGDFLPLLSPHTRNVPIETSAAIKQLFRQDYRDKLVYAALPKEHRKAHSFWQEYLKRQLPAFLAHKK